MLRRGLPGAALLCCGILSIAVTAQSASRDASAPATLKPEPLLPPQGFDDGSGFVLPGADWARATPESEGFSAPRLEALRALLKTHQTDAMMIVSRGHVVF